jgi:hypothetical protein
MALLRSLIGGTRVALEAFVGSTVKVLLVFRPHSRIRWQHLKCRQIREAGVTVSMREKIPGIVRIGLSSGKYSTESKLRAGW